MIKYSKLSTYTIKKIIKCFCVDIEASKTAELLEINRNTINRYYRLFREEIYEYQTLQLEKMLGDVELDESYFGASRPRGRTGKLKRGRGTLKQPVFGVFKRDDMLGKSRVYTQIIPDAKKKTLQAIIRDKVDISSHIHTDGWPGYDGLVDVGYNKHYRVNHSKNEFALKGEYGAEVTVNGIESFWSYTKRRLNKFNGTKKHFELHLKESEWRWSKTTEELIDELTNILKHKR